jgi:hypothetical protein
VVPRWFLCVLWLGRRPGHRLQSGDGLEGVVMSEAEMTVGHSGMPLVLFGMQNRTFGPCFGSTEGTGA